MMVTFKHYGLAALLGLLTMTASADPALLERPAVQAFIEHFSEQHDFDQPTLRTLLGEAHYQESIVKAMEKPSEAKPWYQYRPIFLTPERIQKGLQFWTDHHVALSRAETTYGVPPEIIVAIIGVETFYGKNQGSYRVIDALTTLAFDYPPRAAFFKSELEQYLLLCREQGFDPLVLKGSYAGAMGTPQFISSSYRRYAVNFDGGEQADLLNNRTDAIGSVAHYFAQHGWKKGAPVAVQAQVSDKTPPTAYQALLADPKNPKPQHTVQQLKTFGIQPQSKLSPSEPVALIALEQAQAPEYWLGAHNFYVITRYNHSNLYAMAVYQLSQALKQAHRSPR